MLHGIPLQVTVTCPSCHQPTHVQGLSEVSVCGSCQHSIALSDEQWLEWFGAGEVMEALQFDEGEGRSVTSIGGEMKSSHAYGHRMPRCQSCKTDVPTDQFSAMAAVGGWDCSCGKRIQVRHATPLAQKIMPSARWLVHEGQVGADGAEPQSASEPILFACMSCGGSLTVDGTARMITCQFCQGSNYLPDGLWLRLHPKQTVQTFFLVCELGEDGALPSTFLTAAMRSEDDEVRALVARNPGASAEMLAQLARDEDYVVRRFAVQSGRLSTAALLQVVSEERDSDVLEVLEMIELEPEVLTAMAFSEHYVQRELAAQNPALPEAGLVALADTLSSDVLQALPRRDLSADTLKHFALHRGYACRQVAAAHPNTPPEILQGLLDDTDLRVRQSLVDNPALPPSALLRLANDDVAEIAALAKTQSGYAEALTVHRKQRRRRLLIRMVVVFVLGGAAVVLALVAFLVAYLTGQLSL